MSEKSLLTCEFELSRGVGCSLQMRCRTNLARLMHLVLLAQVQCCFTSTDHNDSQASMLLYLQRDHKDCQGRGSQDSHLDFHTTPLPHSLALFIQHYWSKWKHTCDVCSTFKFFFFFFFFNTRNQRKIAVFVVVVFLLFKNKTTAIPINRIWDVS